MRAASLRLNGITDAAARVIREVEAFLEECRIGIEASVEVEREDETGLGHFSITGLAYQRWQGKFRVVVWVTPCHAQSAEDEVVRPWSESSREEKLKTLVKLPDLLVELAKQVEDRAAKAEQALAVVSSQIKVPKKKGGA